MTTRVHGQLLNLIRFRNRLRTSHNLTLRRPAPVFIDVPKTGGTWVEDTLHEEECLDVAKVSVNAGMDVEYKVAQAECSKWHIPPVGFVPESFATVRNPYSRIVSQICYLERFWINLDRLDRDQSPQSFYGTMAYMKRLGIYPKDEDYFVEHVNAYGKKTFAEYTPPVNDHFVGKDEFAFMLSDGVLQSNGISVSISLDYDQAKQIKSGDDLDFTSIRVNQSQSYTEITVVSHTVFVFVS